METNIRFRCSKDQDDFSYEWVLKELNKDCDIEGICRIGFTDDGYEVFVVMDDDVLSDVPHFHYRKKAKGKPCEFHACIRYDKAEYYHHIGKENTLNNEQKENLIIFLNSKPKNWKNKIATNWELLLFIWNTQNDTKIDYNLSMPDYKKLEEVEK